MSVTENPSPAVPAAASGPGSLPTVLDAARNYGVAVVFVLLFVVLSFASDPFLSKQNLLNILDQNAAVGLIAVGTTVVLISGGFDLSLGAIYALAGVVAAQVAIATGGSEMAIVLGVLAGLVVGTLNGLLITIGRINAFIATLATAIIIGGISVAVAGGELLSVDVAGFTDLGQGDIGGLTYAAIIWLVVSGLVGFVLWRTRFGRHVFATGGNEEAARLSGVRIGRVRTITYALSGTVAGLAGVIVASKVATGQAEAGGFDITVLAFAAVVVGGTSILGGEGAIWRTIVGVLLLALIGNGFVLLEVEPIYQEVMRGGIILAAVGLDAWAREVRK